ncbi:MAG: hypothetical protein JSV30_04515 [Candidatus Omnitrophota bacterium]|nr:MAG: hypothetical protein JSV30_04515 [Candidatus Omnitrophota bacterium]
MESKDYLKDFFVEDEHSFKKEQIISLISRCKKFAKLVGRKGQVHIEKKNLTGTDKIKLLLATRYLGAELAKLEPGLKISPEIANVHTADIAKLLSVSDDNARTRVSDLIHENFGKKPEKGYIRIYPHHINKFLDMLEKEEQKKERTFSKQSSSKKKKKGALEDKKVNIDQIFKRLSTHLNITERVLQDYIFIKDDGSFKFNNYFTGKSKHNKQSKGILSTAFVIVIGLGATTFSSWQVKKVCFNSNIDVTGLNYTIRELKNGGYISKANKYSRDNIILEKGKNKAREIFNELCNIK